MPWRNSPRILSFSRCHWTLSFPPQGRSTKDRACCLIRHRKDSVVWRPAVRWPGHPYHWPRLAKRQNIPTIRLGGGGSALVKVTGTALSKVFQDSAKGGLPKKNNWCSEELIITSVGFRISGFTNFESCSVGGREEGSSFGIFLLQVDVSELIRGWLDAVRPCGESVGFLRDLKGDPYLTSSCVKRKKKKKKLLQRETELQHCLNACHSLPGVKSESSPLALCSTCQS